MTDGWDEQEAGAPSMKAGALRQQVTLALIAHDRKKEALADFALENRAALSRFRLVATQGTGSLVRKRTGLSVHLLKHGPAGGDRELGVLAADSEVQAVIFFRDTDPAGHEPDFTGLLAVCDAEEIPLATNRATAQALLFFLLNSPDRAFVTARPWAYAPHHPGAEAEAAAHPVLVGTR
jgi:methylglyoxal synthase